MRGNERMAERDLPEVFTPLGRLMSRSCGDAPPAPEAAICKFRMAAPRDNPDRLVAASTRPGSQIKTMA